MRKTAAFSITIIALLVAGLAHATSHEGEVMYLADTHFQAHPNHDSHTHIYRVFVDEAGDRADLEFVTDIPLAEAQAIAVTPDGSRLYALDTDGFGFAGTAEMGYLDLNSLGWTSGPVVMYDGSPLLGMVQAAFAPDGRLIVGSQLADMLFDVNLVTGEATPIGPIVDDNGDEVNLFGADLAFDAFGNCYVWTNSAGFGDLFANPPIPPASRGLYRLSVPPTPASPSPIQATFIGNVAGDFFTGLVIRGNGWGNVAFSSTQPGNQIHVHDRDTGVDIGNSPHQMYVDGSPYTLYQYGDMSNGPLAPWGCPRTIGYHKNHDWAVDVTVCEGDDQYVIYEDEGQRHILRGAKNRNYSMLVAQLVAAKLNTMNTSGIPFIDAAEAYLCSKVDTSENAWWKTDFASREDKDLATWHKDILDDFNNNGSCGNYN